MRPVITPAESARLDASSQTPVPVLMDRAGYAVALAAARHGASYGKRVVVLAGPGNNGGDGYVAARYLQARGVAVEVESLGDPGTPAAIAAARAAVKSGVPVRPLSEARDVSMVIDAVFGGGFRAGVPGSLRSWMDTAAPVIAVDIPSGVDPATGAVEGDAFSAVETVAFHALKPGHLLDAGPSHCGVVTVADIGLEGGTPELLLAEASDAPRPGRSRTAHKWSAGSVLVVGGSPGMSGAAILAGRAALRFGAGAVAVATPEATREALAASSPELLTHPISAVEDVAGRFDAVVVGPGLGHGYRDLVDWLLENHAGLLVVDADALVQRSWEGRRGATVLTPHAGEFRRIAGADPSVDAVKEFAAGTGAVVLAKGNPTLITDGSTPWVVSAGGPELASIGTGDVLAGMVAALAVRGLDALTAARSAAYWHGVAGSDLARSSTLTSYSLADHIGRFSWEDPS